MTRGRIKRVFPGNNTPKGFFSYYDYILPKDARRIFVIKGGPGVGKSTFMTGIALHMVRLGYDVELHHCSSDNGSIDGVVFPAIGVGIVDGNSPHVVDPKAPGAVDEIIWLGEYWDEDSVRAKKSQILSAQKGIESVFKRAYRYLSAAQIVYEDWEAVSVEALDFGKANQMAAHMIDKCFGDHPVAAVPGNERKLFASAITPDGMVNYLDTILAPYKTKFVIQGEPGTGKSYLLDKVRRAALERGFFVEAFHCPMHPDKVEHVVVPELGLAFAKSIEPHTYVPSPADTIIDMDECCDPSILALHQKQIKRAQDLFQRLFDLAIFYIGEAKQYHDVLERCYAPNMDFAGIDRLRDRITQKVLGYAQEAEEAAGNGT